LRSALNWPGAVAPPVSDETGKVNAGSPYIGSAGG
jgi:hypothetical protein